MTLEELERITEGKEWITIKEAADFMRVNEQQMRESIRLKQMDHVGAHVMGERTFRIPRNRFIAHYKFPDAAKDPSHTVRALLEAYIMEMDSKREILLGMLKDIVA